MSRKLKIIYYVEPNPAALASRAAQYFVEMAEEAVGCRGRARIAISGGSTPKAAFQLMGDPHQPWRARMPWDQLDLYWVDERCVPPDDQESNFRMTREALLDHAPLRPEQIHRMEGELDPEVAAAQYESGLRNGFRLEGAEAPRFDLVQLGYGAGRPHGVAVSAYRGIERNDAAGNGQSCAANGHMAHHAYLAGHQSCALGFLPD